MFNFIKQFCNSRFNSLQSLITKFLIFHLPCAIVGLPLNGFKVGLGGAAITVPHYAFQETSVGGQINNESNNNRTGVTIKQARRQKAQSDQKAIFQHSVFLRWKKGNTNKQRILHNYFKCPVAHLSLNSLIERHHIKATFEEKNCKSKIKFTQLMGAGWREGGVKWTVKKMRKVRQRDREKRTICVANEESRGSSRSQFFSRFRNR